MLEDKNQEVKLLLKYNNCKIEPFSNLPSSELPPPPTHTTPVLSYTCGLRHLQN